MHSPLPDSSALEAGILEDAQPSRLSRVQDNVRNLLRNSRFSSPTPSFNPPEPTAYGQHAPDLDGRYGLLTPPASPTRVRRMPQQPEVIPSPTAESVTSNSTSSTISAEEEVETAREVHFTPSGYRHTILGMAHQSALFNTRAVAALDHPDLSDPSLAVYARRKHESRHQKAWKRSRRGKNAGRGAVEVGSSQCLLCVLAALLLSAIVATCMSSYLCCVVKRWCADTIANRCGACDNLDGRHANIPYPIRAWNTAGDSGVRTHGCPHLPAGSTEVARQDHRCACLGTKPSPAETGDQATTHHACTTSRAHHIHPTNTDSSSHASRRSATGQSRS